MLVQEEVGLAVAGEPGPLIALSRLAALVHCISRVAPAVHCVCGIAGWRLT